MFINKVHFCLLFVQASCSRTGCVCSSGSVTVRTHWDRSGQPAACIRWTVTTAAALTDSSSAPITAARPPAPGAPGPVGHCAAFPVGRAGEPDTGEGKPLINTQCSNYPFAFGGALFFSAHPATKYVTRTLC